MALPASLERETGYASGLTPVLGNALTVSIDDSGEQNLDLTWPFSVPVYHRMRTDAKIAETLRALTLPIRAARRHLDPNGAPPDVVQHIASDLGVRVMGAPDSHPPRSRGRFSLDEHLRLALLHPVYGHMPFEQLYRIDTTGPKPLARLAKLALRHPLTIQQIDVARDGGLVSFTQHPLQLGTANSGQPKPITVDRTVWYANDREGGAWQGRSILREAYGPWRRKDDALRTWLTALRRNGIGQPVYHGAPNETATQLQAGAQLAQRSRAGETAGVGVPNGASMTWEGVRGTLPDHEAFVRYCDQEIASSVLAEFLRLGSTGSGSTRALGETFLDFFTLCDQAMADDLTRTFNEHVIEDLVDLSYGPDMPAPRLVLEDVGAQHDITAESLNLLLTAGALSADPALEQHVRETWRLPARTAPLVTPAAPAAPPPAAPVTPAQPAAAAAAPATPPAGQSTDFDALLAEWQQALDGAVASTLTVRATHIDDLTQQVQAAAGQIPTLSQLTLAAGATSGVLLAWLTSLWGSAATRMAGEAAAQGQPGVTADPDLEFIRGHADVVADLLDRSLVSSAMREALRLSTLDPSVTAAAVREHLQALTDAQPRDLLGEALWAVQSRARTAVMEQLVGGTFHATERLDTNTCAPCVKADGTAYATILDAARAYPTGGYVDCLGGGRCRGLLVWHADPGA